MFHDEKPPDDSSLFLPDVTVVEADNAYVDVQKLGTDFKAADPNTWQPYEDKAVDQMLAGGAWDDTHATEVLSKYATAINDFHAAAKKLYYQDPYAAHPNTVTFENLYLNDIGTARSTGKLVALESFRKAKNGDVAGGLAEATEVVKLAQMLELDQPTLISWLVGSATKQIGLSALRQIALQVGITAEQSKYVSQTIEQYRDAQAGLVKVMKLEYAYYQAYPSIYTHLGIFYDQYFLSSADGASHRSMTGKIISLLDDVGITRFYFWPNQNHRFVVESHQQMVVVAQADCATSDLGEQYPPQRSYRTGLGRLIEPNAIGKMLFDIGRISFGGITTKRCNEQLAVSATQTAFAINAYKHDNGKIPATLNDLVPKYLTGVPLDPYNNKPLIYDAAQKIVYSVGQDRKDDHGNTKRMTDYTNPGQEWQNMFDPTFVVSQ